MQPTNADTSNIWASFEKEITEAIKNYEANPGWSRQHTVQDKIRYFFDLLPKAVADRPQNSALLEKFMKSTATTAKESCSELTTLVHTLAQTVLVTKEERFQVALRAATGHPEDALKLIRQFNITDQNECMILAKLYFASQEPVIASHKDLDFLSDANRHKICQIAMDANPERNIENFKYFGIKNEMERFEYAKTLAEKYPKEVGKNIKGFELGEEQRVAVAKIIANQMKNTDVIGYLKDFNIPNVTPLLEIIELACPDPDECMLYANDFFDYQSDIPNEKITCRVAPEFTSLNDQVGKIADPLAKRESTQFLGYMNWLCRTKSSQQKKEMLPFISAILNVQDPKLRYQLSPFLIKSGPPPLSASVPERAQLFHLVLHPLKKDAVGVDILGPKEWELIFKNLESIVYKDATKRRNTLKNLRILVECGDLTVRDKKALLKEIFCKTDQKGPPPHSSLGMLGAIIQLEEPALLSQKLSSQVSEKEMKATAAAGPKNLGEILKSIFIKRLKIAPRSDFEQRYESTFGRERYENGIMIYASQLKDTPEAMQALTSFATAILENRYREMRYHAPPNSHLSKLFEKREALKKMWVEGEAINLKGIDQDLEAAAVPSLDLKAVLRDLSKADPAFDKLSRCLDHPDECEKALEKLAEESKKISKAIKQDSSLVPVLNTLKLEAELIRLLSYADADMPKEKVEVIKKIIPFLQTRYGEKSVQVENFKKLKESEAPANYTVADTDHWEDLLLIGTEISGSCLSILSDGSTSKSLLGCLVDGKTRAIVLKKEGKIIARSLLTMLMDKAGNPVLVQQPFFSTPNPTENMRKVVNDMCIRRARQLGLPLFPLENLENSEHLPKKPVRHGGELHSLGSPSPFESIESAGGAQKLAGGVGFTLQAPFLIDTESDVKQRRSL